MTPPAYDLAIHGFRDFARFGQIIDQQSISRDPLSGVIDGANRVFHTNYFPILTSGSLGVYVSGATVPGTAEYNTGEITLDTAPASQPVASYVFTPWTTTQILQMLLRGMDLMEIRWTRGWRVVDSSGSPAIETSANLLIADSDGNDPVIGSSVFSLSRAQVGFYMLCCERAWMGNQLRHSARTAFMYRETLRGMTVDKSMMPKNMALALEDLDRELGAALFEAMGEFYGDSGYGGAILNPATAGYMSNFEWQSDSKLFDYRTMLGFHYAYRPIA